MRKIRGRGVETGTGASCEGGVGVESQTQLARLSHVTGGGGARTEEPNSAVLRPARTSSTWRRALTRDSQRVSSACPCQGHALSLSWLSHTPGTRSWVGPGQLSPGSPHSPPPHCSPTRSCSACVRGWWGRGFPCLHHPQTRGPQPQPG